MDARASDQPAEGPHSVFMFPSTSSLFTTFDMNVKLLESVWTSYFPVSANNSVGDARICQASAALRSDISPEIIIDNRSSLNTQVLII
jgi:hypothetical protein